MTSARAFALTCLFLGACALGATEHEDDGATSAAPSPAEPLEPRPPRSSTANPRQSATDVTARAGELGAFAPYAWDFEAASPDCNGWTVTNARAIRSVPSHSGAYACKLCPDAALPSSATIWLTRSVGAVN